MTGLMPHFRRARHQPPWNSITLLKRKIPLDMNSLANYWPTPTLPFFTKVIKKAVLKHSQPHLDLARCL